MAFLPRPVTRMMLSTPDATASSTPYWMIGLSTRGSISLGWALVAGRKRVPSPAAGKTALRTFAFISQLFYRLAADTRAINGPIETIKQIEIIDWIADLPGFTLVLCVRRRSRPA